MTLVCSEAWVPGEHHALLAYATQVVHLWRSQVQVQAVGTRLQHSCRQQQSRRLHSTRPCSYSSRQLKPDISLYVYLRLHLILDVDAGVQMGAAGTAAVWQGAGGAAATRTHE